MVDKGDWVDVFVRHLIDVCKGEIEVDESPDVENEDNMNIIRNRIADALMSAREDNYVDRGHYYMNPISFVKY